ncbi:MAG: cupredoxin domain-containing protein [Acidobacteria bacterium]|jgi:hypothetical protein|nr:cupredoxin domain-containing protein [Acidobacteriota bacterium]
MSEDESIFKDYMTEKKGFSHFIRQPKSWLLIFSIVLAIILAILFYKSVILDTMSAKEVADSIELVWHDTKWVEKESTPNEVKVVPSITFKIKNTGKRALEYLNLEGVFEIEETGKILSDGATQAFRDKPLLPGEVSDNIFIKAFFGYSGRTKAQIIENKEWKQIRVKIFARTKGSSPVAIGEIYPIKKEIEGFTGKAVLDENAEKLGKSLRIVTQDSIWVDRVRSAKKSIIVPSITFQVKNVGAETIQDVIFKGEFSFQDNNEKLSEGIVEALKKPLEPGASSDEITLQSELGYEATSKEAFIKNPQEWRKVDVRIYAKQKDFEYVLLGTFSIRQEVEGVQVIYQFQQK